MMRPVHKAKRKPAKRPPTNQRLQRLAEALEEKKLSSLLVSSVANRFFLTGWQGDSESGYLLVTSKKSFLFTDSRYTEHATNLVNGFEIVEIIQDFGSSLEEVLVKEKIKSVGFEASDISVSSFRKLKKALQKARLVSTEGIVERLRDLKDDSEIEALKKTARVTDLAFKHILNFIKPGLKESEIAFELTKFMRSQGAQGNAWDPLIVAVGANASMPHYGAGEAKVKKGDLVLLDFGANVSGYVSDMTRVVFVGEPDREKKRIYQAVLKAQELGIDLVKPGVKTALIDQKVRQQLEKESQYLYQHGLGHGVGIEVHEAPGVSQRSKAKLQIGNVITIEPGIYIPGWGGVRIEDVVLVTQNGHQTLTKSPKQIDQVTIRLK